MASRQQIRRREQLWPKAFGITERKRIVTPQILKRKSGIISSIILEDLLSPVFQARFFQTSAVCSKAYHPSYHPMSYTLFESMTLKYSRSNTVDTIWRCTMRSLLDLDPETRDEACILFCLGHGRSNNGRTKRTTSQQRPR
jgi:hypothetical protein